MNSTDTHDQIVELTRYHTHREPLPTRLGWHTTWVPPLIVLLLAATDTTRGTGILAGTTPTSRPAARIEALATLILIDREATDWLRRLDPGQAPSSTIAALRLLDALAAGLPTPLHRPPAHQPGRRVDCCSTHRLAADVRTWWQQARIITGWDSPAYRPAASCPACGRRGTLRIGLHTYAALCVDCRTTWARETIDDLARHIRTEQALDHLVLTPSPAVA